VTEFGLAESGDGDGPDAGQIEKLRTLRQTFEEMVAGAQAIETTIQRGYLDVKPD